MHVFKVVFLSRDKVYEVYAKAVRQGELYGFVEIEELVFGESSQLLVDPAEERLKSEFEGVKRSLIPIHSVIRIDQVEKEGRGKIRDLDGGSTVTPFPSPILPTDKGTE